MLLLPHPFVAFLHMCIGPMKAEKSSLPWIVCTLQKLLYTYVVQIVAGWSALTFLSSQGFGGGLLQPNAMQRWDVQNLLIQWGPHSVLAKHSHLNC